MEQERYKILAAFDYGYYKASSAKYKVLNSHFWQLIREYTREDGVKTQEPEDVIFKGFYGLSRNASFQKVPLQANYTHIVYGDRIEEKAAKERWNQAKTQIVQLFATIHLTQRPHILYQYFANLLQIEAYAFLKENLDTDEPAYDTSPLMIEYPIAHNIRYVIQAAMHTVTFKIGNTTIKPFPVSNLRAGHHFWQLVAKQNNQEYVVETFHGLAAKPSADLKQLKRVPIAKTPMQSWGAYLKAYCLMPPIKDIEPKSTSFGYEHCLDDAKRWIPS